MSFDPVVIVSYARTPMGGFQGVFAAVKATDLGATAVRAAVARAGVAPDLVERLYMGCVLPAGLGQAPARQVALGAGLPESVEATTLNKMCGSGMQAAIMAHEAIASGAVDVVIAGGMESMSNAPYALPKHRSGARIIATLLAALERRGAHKGVASLCIGGGEATAVALEMI